MEQFQKWPLLLKICAVTVFGSTAVAVLINRAELAQLSPDALQSQDQGSESQTPKVGSAATEQSRISFDLIVLSESEKQPIEGVDVLVVSKGPPETRKTDSSGFIQLDIPERSDLQITLSKSGFHSKTVSINLSNDPNRTRTYYLKSKS